MKIIRHLILPFAIIMSFLSPSQAVAKNANGFKNIDVVKTDTTNYTVLFISPFIDSSHTDLDLYSNTSSDDSAGGDLAKSDFLLNPVLCGANSSHTTETSLKNKQLLLGNMIPVKNIPRYILFHTLQIPF